MRKKKKKTFLGRGESQLFDIGFISKKYVVRKPQLLMFYRGWRRTQKKKKREKGKIGFAVGGSLNYIHFSPT